jgi:glycosyltransferase involved in cell wall biosynthesis
MAQDAYNVTKAMRARGIRADLLITSRERYAFSMPLWEDGNLSRKAFGDPMNPNNETVNHYDMPDWIKIVRVRSDFKVLSEADLLAKLLFIFRRYNIIFAHVPGSMYAMLLRCNYVPYDAGLIRYLPFLENRLPPYRQRTYVSIAYEILKKSYENAPIILFTNPDTLRIFKEAKLRVRFVPFAIPCDKYSPKPKKGLFKGHELVFFMPSRHHWKEKGTDRVINAFSRFAKRDPTSLLVMVDWGTNITESKELIRKLAIPSKNILFVPPMPKKDLIDMYNEADVVLDQFTLGSWGTATPEAMACEKPVIMYYDAKVINECFGSLPPILNARTTDEIYQRMIECRDPEARRKVGVASRTWVKRTHDPSLVVDIHIATAKEVLQKK